MVLPPTEPTGSKIQGERKKKNKRQRVEKEQDDTNRKVQIPMMTTMIDNMIQISFLQTAMMPKSTTATQNMTTM